MSSDRPALGPREVRGGDGRVVARVTVVDRGDWHQADVEWVADSVRASDLAGELTAMFAGMRVSTTDSELAAALVDAGGRTARVGVQLQYLVADAPPPPEWLDRGERDGVRLVDYRPVDEEIAAAWMAAYPPTHPDHDASLTDIGSTVADLAAIQSNAVTGRFSPEASALAVDGSGAVLGGIMVTLMQPNPHWTGPWVPDVFVRPDAQGRGIGARLVRYAVTAVAAAGEKGLALSVTDGNPARRVYERVGFTPGVAFTSVAIPPA